MSKKILIITPSWIGDCVMTQPLYRRLHELHPGCTIDAFAPKWSMAVFERMPEISRVMENPFGHGALELKKRWHIGRELGKEGYDQVIVLPGSLKSAIIALATGIKQRTGYVGESRYFLLNDIRKLDKGRVAPDWSNRYNCAGRIRPKRILTGIPIIRVLRLIPKAVKPLWQNMVWRRISRFWHFVPVRSMARPSVGLRVILPNSVADIWQRVGRFGCLVRKKILILQMKSTDFQTAFAPIFVAKPIFLKPLICCLAPIRLCATTAV